MISIPKDQLEPLFNLYTNAELALMLRCSRERARQLREEFKLPVGIVEYVRNQEFLRQEYQRYALGQRRTEHGHVKEFAMENRLPWPPSIFQPEKFKYTPKEYK